MSTAVDAGAGAAPGAPALDALRLVHRLRGAAAARPARAEKNVVPFILRTIMQPFLLVFVFTYVFPKIGQGVGGSSGSEAQFSTLLVAGVIGMAMIMFQGIQAVALPMVQEFGYTREIEDRVLAPLPVWGVAVEKIVSGAVQALISALVVFPIASGSRPRRSTSRSTGCSCSPWRRSEPCSRQRSA